MIDGIQRKLVLGIVVATIAALAGTIAALASGGRPDPPALRAAAVLLDGEWRFRTGDDPRWADPDTDDSAWERLNMTAVPGSHDGDVGLPDYVSGWTKRGHPGYYGYAWYRRFVSVPAGGATWAVLGPSRVDDGYELYWNGRLLGGSGTLGPTPHLVGTRPLRFGLPVDAAGTRGVIAVRVYMFPRSGGGGDGGGMHSPPMLAPRPISSALHLAHWKRTIAGYIVDAVEPMAMVGLIVLAFWGWSYSRNRAFLAVACTALALTAVRRLNNAIVSWTDLEDLRTYSWLASWMWAPIVAAWALAWNRWCTRPSRLVDASAVVLSAAGLIGTVAHFAAVTNASRLGLIVVFVLIALRIVRTGAERILALAALALVVAGLFGGELLDTIGVPGIWFPFGIGVSRTQYIYAMTFPLLALLIVKSLGFEDGDPTRD